MFERIFGAGFRSHDTLFHNFGSEGKDRFSCLPALPGLCEVFFPACNSTAPLFEFPQRC